jgi:hypothetical protein
MSSLIVELGKERPQVSIIDDDLQTFADRYARNDGFTVHCDEDHFYDLLEDVDGRICGLQLHVDEHHPLRTQSHQRPYLVSNPFPTIKFSRPAHWREKGLEALSDIVMVVSADNDPILGVSLDWLSGDDKAAIATLLR